MRQVAKIVCLFENEAPVVVLSAMGKTTNNLIIAGEQAVLCSASEVKELEPLRKIRELHEATLAELEVDQETCDDVMALLDELTIEGGAAGSSADAFDPEVSAVSFAPPPPVVPQFQMPGGNDAAKFYF